MKFPFRSTTGTRALGALTALLVTTLVATISAHANGRPPSSSSLHFRTGHPNDIIAGMTWGLLVSHDGGQTFEWFCESAVGYSGSFDPDYEYLADGTILATTFDGLLASRNGCTFDQTPLSSLPSTPPNEKKFISTIAQGPDGALYAADSGAASLGKIYKSIDSGVTWPVAVVVGQTSDWWSSIEVAPSDKSRVYLFGYRLESGQPRKFLAFRSIDGGVTYQAIPTSGFATSEQSSIDVAAISSTNANELWARVSTPVAGTGGTDYYRSVDGGLTWAKRLSVEDFSASFVLRSNGEIYVGSQQSKSFKSTDRGATFKEISPQLRSRCAVEAPDKSVWVCAQDQPPDAMSIGKSTDLSTWQKVYRFSETTKPVTCQSGQVQYDECQLQTWCMVKMQLGITSTAVDCNVVPMVDAGLPLVKPPEKGCCDAGAPGSSSMLMGFGVGLLLLRRRRGSPTPLATNY